VACIAGSTGGWAQQHCRPTKGPTRLPASPTAQTPPLLAPPPLTQLARLLDQDPHLLTHLPLARRSWLPEHPGGSRIIPTQSLNLDCARFFELYHASRESFLYLQVGLGGGAAASRRCALARGPAALCQLGGQVAGRDERA
jgi:hypothetical protein